MWEWSHWLACSKQKDMHKMRKLNGKKLLLRLLTLSVFCSAFLVYNELDAQDSPAKNEKKTRRVRKGAGAASEDAAAEINAQRLLNKGIEYLENGREETGIKTITQIAQQYPKTKAVIKADLVLGNHYLEKKQYDLAIKRLQKTAIVEDPEIQAESLYKIGICYYNSSQYNQAFGSLRQVVNKYPGSIYANEACYYIGLCHFSLGRWTQAVDALERVGTSIPPEESGTVEGKEVFAEAGHRLFVKIYDEDLVVLFDDESKKLNVTLTNENGDSESIVMEMLGKDGATFIGSIIAAPGVPMPNDGTLQTKGGDVVTVTYVDTHTASGDQNRKVMGKVSLVSTASVGFTSGDYVDYAGGVYADQKFFMRVRDLDCDTTPGKDTLKVKVSSLHKVEKEMDKNLDSGVALDEEEEPEFQVRDSKEYVLTETGDRTGIFVGSDEVRLTDPEMQLEALDSDQKSPLKVEKDDILTIEYLDEVHIGGRNDPQTRKFTVKLLTGEVPDVVTETRQVKDLDMRAKKNLLEAKMLLRLGQIFKDVGLIEYANSKAQEGVDRIDELLKINMEASLERTILEDAFNAKWELLIVQNKIKEAIQVCSTLIKMFPDSSLVDKALMKIAEVKILEGSERSRAEGMNIYRGILQLPKSELKPEAQFQIASVSEAVARAKAKEALAKDPTYRPNYGMVMTEYKKCADNYPDSPWAGKALEKIADYYIETEDFPRVLEMMEQVFRDYPDADFLHAMLYKWVVAAFKLGKFDLANEKCEQVMSEYPNTESARKAIKMKELIRKRLEAAGANE